MPLCENWKNYFKRVHQVISISYVADVAVQIPPQYFEEFYAVSYIYASHTEGV